MAGQGEKVDHLLDQDSLDCEALVSRIDAILLKYRGLLEENSAVLKLSAGTIKRITVFTVQEMFEPSTEYPDGKPVYKYALMRPLSGQIRICNIYIDTWNGLSNSRKESLELAIEFLTEEMVMVRKEIDRLKAARKTKSLHEEMGGIGFGNMRLSKNYDPEKDLYKWVVYNPRTNDTLLSFTTYGSGRTIHNLFRHGSISGNEAASIIHEVFSSRTIQYIPPDSPPPPF